METLTVPIPLECMLDPCHPKYLSSFPFGAAGEGGPQPLSSFGTACQRLLYSSDCRRAALETVDRLTESLDFTDYASRIIHPIVRTLDQSPELRPTAMDTLSSLVFQLGKKVRQPKQARADVCLPLGGGPSVSLNFSVCQPVSLTALSEN